MGDILNQFQNISLEDIILEDINIDIPIISENNIQKSQLKNQIIFFDIQEYLFKIYQSYKFNPKLIINQFNLDFNRTDIYLNNKPVNKSNFLLEIKKYQKKYINIFNKIIPGDIFIMLFCTQAVFAFPFFYYG